MKLVCPIERQRLTNGRINLVKQKQALLRPKGRTAEVKYLTTPEKGQAKPRYFWWSRQISTWLWPDLWSHVKNQYSSSRTWDSERKSPYLNLGLTKQLLKCLRSIKRRNFFPSATVKVFTQNGGTTCSTIQPLQRSSVIASATNTGCRNADLFFFRKHCEGYWAKGNHA